MLWGLQVQSSGGYYLRWEAAAIIVVFISDCCFVIVCGRHCCGLRLCNYSFNFAPRCLSLFAITVRALFLCAVLIQLG